ncbi:transposase family protein [Streptomyces chartreusis]|uniref:transposase family protein n=1 Tax=Streptomyces chartreusis TaxID=1969 RepID=UPI003D754214
MAEYRITGLSPTVIAELIAGVGPLLHEQQHQARLTARPRRRAGGAGAKHRFVFVDRLLATLVSLRHGTTHGCWAAGSEWTAPPSPVPSVRCGAAAARAAGLHRRPGTCLGSVAEVIGHLDADGRTGIIDGTEIRVRRLAAGLKDRDRFVSGKAKRNAVEAMVLTDAEGRLLFCSPVRPGSCADITQARQLGLAQLLAGGPFMEILADSGYQGMGAQTGGRVVTPPHRKFKKNAPAWYEERHELRRKAHSSRRIRVGHGIAHLKNWQALARHLGRREHMSDIVQAVAGLPSHQQTATLTRSLRACTEARN